MKKIKTIFWEIGQFIETYRMWRKTRHMNAMFSIVECVFKFVAETHKEQKPMLTHIGLININDGEEMCNMVDLWAGIGEGNPIQRITILRNRHDEMLKILTKIHNKEDLNEMDNIMVQVAVKMWK